ncbi:hypothetical protein KCU88_g5753, partial [Aureobasidium melanogenum]
MNQDEDRIFTVNTEFALDVKVVTQIFERDEMIPGTETPSGDGYSWPPPPIFQRTAGELIDAEYTLVRVALEGHGTVDLDETVGNILQVPSITPLNDGSWEILVRFAYLPTLQKRLHETHVRFTLDSEYNPLTPLHEDVEYWGLQNARELYALWFTERAIRITRKAWAIAQMY